MRGNIRRLAAQRADLRGGGRKILFFFGPLVHERELLFLRAGALPLPVFHFATRLRGQLRESVRRAGQRPIEFAAGRLGAGALAQSLIARFLERGALRLQAFDSLAAQFAVLPFEIRQLRAFVFQRRALALRIAIQPFKFHAKLIDALLEQRQPARLAISVDPFPYFFRVALLLDELLQFGMLLARGQKRLHLLASRHHGLVRGVQLCEFVHQALGRIESLGPIEHEIAQEGVEIAQILGGLRLVQQLQRQFALDAQKPHEALAVGAELLAGEHVGVGALQFADIEIEILHFAQVERALENQIVAADVARTVGGAAQPEQLHQHHGIPGRIAERES